MGYHPHWVAPPGKDGGVDIIAYPDPLGTKRPRIKVQVKRQKEKTNREVLSAASLAQLGDQDIGLFMNTGGFTRDAEEFARSQERRQITLIDLEHLVVSGLSIIQNWTIWRATGCLACIYFVRPRQGRV